MRRKKYKKSVNKTEELPNFLLGLKGIPEDIDLPSRLKKNDDYLGPIFIGECLRYYPPHTSVPLGSFHHIQIYVPSEENILKDVFLPKTVTEEKVFESKTFHPVIRRKKVFDDPFPHKCPGVRKVFAPDNFLSEGLGETKSVIEGETSREIPFCRFKKTMDSCNPQILKTEVEVVTLSDIREEKRKLLSEKERWVFWSLCKHCNFQKKLEILITERAADRKQGKAHAHFPKEFVTLRIIGPTIPESITITKLPSKRQTQYEIGLHLKSKGSKTSDKKEDKDIEISQERLEPITEKEEEESKESTASLSGKKEFSIEERADSDNIRQQSEEFKDEDGSKKSEIIKDKEEEEEEKEEEEEEREGEWEEALEEGEEEVLADEEKEGTLVDVEEGNHEETAED